MSFLNLGNKTILVTGVANKKSVATHIGKTLEAENANVLYSVRSEERKQSVAKLIDPDRTFVCDVERDEDIARLKQEISEKTNVLHGLVHSIAFANFSEGLKPFHQTSKKDFLQCVDISCYSLINLANAFKDLFDPDASVVTISISTTRMAAENYGYMGPVKAALDSRLYRFLPARRAVDPAQTGVDHAGSGQRGGVSVERTCQRHQRPGHRARRRYVRQLLRPGHRQKSPTSRIKPIRYP